MKINYFRKKRSIIDVWQGSKYDRVLNIPGLFRIQQGSKFASVVIISGFWIYHDSEYASSTEYTKGLTILGLYASKYVCLYLNMSAYARICMSISTSAWMVFPF